MNNVKSCQKPKCYIISTKKKVISFSQEPQSTEPWNISLWLFKQALFNKYLFNSILIQLTFPPCFSVSRLGGPQLQSRDLEASDRSAAHSLTAQYSKQREACYVIVFIRKVRDDNEKRNTQGQKRRWLLCPSWRKLPQSCGCVHHNKLWWGQRCRSSLGRWQGRRDSSCRRPWRRQSSPSGPDELRLLWCCRQTPGHHRNQRLLQQCSAGTITRRCCCYFIWFTNEGF